MHASVSTQDFQKLDISIRCRNLPKMDRSSQSDPFAILFLSDPNTQVYSNGQVVFNKGGGGGNNVLLDMRTKPNNDGKMVGRTETMKDCPDPDFIKTFQVDYHFEENQILTCKLYDSDARGSTNLDDHDYIGECKCSIGQLMGSKGNTLNFKLNKGGSIALRAEEVTDCNDQVELNLHGKGLANKDGWFGTSDPFLEISRINEDGTWTVVYRSEVIMNNLSPTFPPITIQVQKLTNGDYHRPLKLSINDWDKDGSHDDMGFVQTTLQELLDRVGKPEGRMPVRNSNPKKKGKTTGTLIVHSARIFQVPSLAQFISGGMQVNLMVAVDYTGSNGSPMEPRTLHYMDPRGAPNQYQSAISAIGSILQEYDTDKQFPMWGFGARINGVVNHCFQVGATPEVQGVHGMQQAYREVFSKGITMSGPTLFSQIISAAREKANTSARQFNGQSYSVLLILTDGVINDIEGTIDEIVLASACPLSIIVVGVGNADFTAMNELDGDGGTKLKNKFGQECKRDIVQFVPYSKHSHSPSRLAAETLSEIPRQLTDYMSACKIKPLPGHPPPVYEDVPDYNEQPNYEQQSNNQQNINQNQQQQNQNQQNYDHSGGPPPPRMFDVVIQPGSTPGMTITVHSPDGQPIRFIVPEGCPVGASIQLQY